jgi:hypothetical protein
MDDIELLFLHKSTVQHHSIRFCDHKRFCRVLRPGTHLQTLIVRQYFIADTDRSVSPKMKEFQTKK